MTAMLGYIKSKLLGEASPKPEKRMETASEGVSLNPINELQILEGHTDIVRILIKIDEMRIASGADDGLIILWNRITGEKVLTLKGHTLPITCMILIERYKLISGSADKTMRIWELRTGQCLKVLKGHEGSVKCIVPLAGRFCSGSNDRQLLIWKNDGDLVSKIERREEENIQCLLPISGNRLVTGSNSSLLLVYKIDTSKVQILAYHRESVRCLVRISASLFASGSMDGAVVIWQTESLTPIKILNNPEKYRNEDRIYIYNVKYLLPLGEKFLAAAIGNGFKVYDIDTEECVMDCSNAHDAEVNCLISLYDGVRIISCSADACIRIWGTVQKVNFRRKREKDEEKAKPKKGAGRLDAVCLGEMWGHSDSVNALLGFTENSFASCSGDGTVILWKDGRVESEFRNIFAAAVIQHQNMEIDNFFNQEDSDKPKEHDDSASSSNSSMNYFKDPTAFYATTSSISTTTTTTSTATATTSPDLLRKQEETLSSSLGASSKPTRVPEYIFDFAERLRKEKKLSIEQISANLRQIGHSESIVSAVAQKQFALIQEEEATAQ